MTQEERTLGGLSHLGVLFGWIGLAFQIVLLVVYQPKSRYIAGHVKQALGAWVTFFLVRLLVGAMLGGTGVWMAMNPIRAFDGSFLGSVLLAMALFAVAGLVALVLVIMAMVKGFSGERHRYPVIGDLIASIAGE